VKKGRSQVQTPTLVGPDCLIEGHIKQVHHLRIEGTFIGQISAVKEIIIGERGHLQGNLQADSVIIFGQVQGDILASSIEIKPSGKVRGNLHTASIAIQQGGLYEGQLTMDMQVLTEAQQTIVHS